MKTNPIIHFSRRLFWFSSIRRGGKLLTCLMAILMPLMLSAQSASEPEPVEAFPVACLANVADPLELPIIEIQVNIHFVGPVGNNFVPGTPSENEQASISGGWNGNYAAIEMVKWANFIMSDLKVNPLSVNLGLPNFLGDSRIRYKLYTESGNANDLYGGIWYWATMPAISTLTYGNKVIHVIVKDMDVPYTGATCGVGVFCNSVTMANWYSRLVGPIPEYSGNSYGTALAVSKSFIHEVGHIAGLCHSFSLENECEDINVASECATGSGAGSCENADALCQNYGSGSHNIMGHNGNARALSPCQWRRYYGRFLAGALEGEKAPYVKTLGCQSGIIMPPITIKKDTDVNWSTPRVVGGPVIVESNATLTISCAHFFGPGAIIKVERGGKLRIVNGAIYAPCGPLSWEGIYVEGNAHEIQPDPEADVDQYADYLSGVVYLDGAYISGAYTAINTWKEGQFGNPDYWGGVVYAKGSTFENNRRGVAFMPYSRDNKSAFLENCHFREAGNVIPVTRGVSIWGCYGIDFEETTFENLDIAGIYGIDFGLTNVKKNHFINCDRGIEIYSTAPITNFQHRIGGLLEEKNYFTNGQAGIYVESDDELRGLEVFNNDFINAEDRSIYLSGPARFDIRYNVLQSNIPEAFYAWQTQGVINRFQCNYVIDPVFVGAHILGDNYGLRILYNQFQQPSNRDILLKNVANVPGRIFDVQGSIGNPADNCFSLPSHGIGTSGSTQNFTYLFRENPQQATDCTTLLPVIGSSNYTLEPTSDNGSADCTPNTLPVLPPYDKPELVQANNSLNLAEANWQARPNNIEFHAAYLQARDNKNIILQSLLIEALDAQNYTEAATLLTEEGTPQAQRWLLSIKLIAKDFVGAQQVWNVLPSTTQDEQWFRDIMQMNIQRLQNIGTYTLLPTQVTTLYTIANSESPYRSYARALLALLKGERFPMDEIEMPLSELPQSPQPAAILKPVPVFSVAPNPANEVVEVRYPVSGQNEQPKQLYIANLNSGRYIKNITLDDSGLYHIFASDLPPGVYYLRIHDKTGILYQTKLILLPRG